MGRVEWIVVEGRMGGIRSAAVIDYSHLVEISVAVCSVTRLSSTVATLASISCYHGVE